MKLTKRLRASITALTCCGLLTGQLANAAGPQAGPAVGGQVAPAMTIQDVALQTDGALHGHILVDQGTPSRLPVVVLRGGQEIARTQTDMQGQFVVPGLTGGMYEVQTPLGGGLYRAWAPRTAPPSAASSAVIAPGQVVRGQHHHALGWLANPWVLGLIVAGAIAIPLALDDDDAS